jgi:hypothetical protein
MLISDFPVTVYTDKNKLEQRTYYRNNYYLCYIHRNRDVKNKQKNHTFHILFVSTNPSSHRSDKIVFKNLEFSLNVFFRNYEMIGVKY